MEEWLRRGSSSLPRSGGEGNHSPQSEWWRGRTRQRHDPSTMLRMVPLPIVADREDLGCGKRQPRKQTAKVLAFLQRHAAAIDFGNIADDREP